MYYHAIVETTEKNKKDVYERCYEFDVTDLNEIIDLIARPYSENRSIYINGRRIEYQNIRTLQIKSSDAPSELLVDIAQRNIPSGVIMVHTAMSVVNGNRYVKDVTKEVLKSIGGLSTGVGEVESLTAVRDKQSVFIVHGRDHLAKVEAARFVENLGLRAVILHEQVSAGNTIIEKIEEHSNVGFAIVLYTPCDLGGLADADVQKARARQNVVFEHGYMISKLGRGNVCALVQGDVELPNDISGVVYIPLDTQRAWQYSLAKELRASGYSIDMNKI